MSRILSLVFLGGCSSLLGQFSRQEFKDQLYEQNIVFTIDGDTEVRGLGVVSRATKMKIEAEFPEGDFVKIQSCHGVEKREREGDHATFNYAPSEIERSRYCPLEFYAVENKRGRRGFGTLLFKDPAFTMPARMECNWHTSTAADMACQAQAGSTQALTFTEPVVWSGKAIRAFGNDTACTLVTTDDKRFEVPVSHGICTFYFIAKSSFTKRASLYLYGHKGFVVEQ